ncbi:MAG: M67 family metallopeptidase [Sphingobium sp.]
MMVRISTTLLDRLIADAAAHDVEICGLLLGSQDHVLEARACANVAADPARTFEIDPIALIAAHRTARAGDAQLIGYYHSHPSGSPIPSVTDAASAAPDGSYWLILGGGAARLWRAVPGEGGTRFVEAALATD